MPSRIAQPLPGRPADAAPGRGLTQEDPITWVAVAALQAAFVLALAMVESASAALWIGLAVSPLLLYLGVRWPQATLAVYVSSAAFKAGVAVPVDITVLLAAVLILAVGVRVARDGLPEIPPLVMLLLGLFAIVAIGAAYSHDPAYGLDKAARLLAFGTTTIAAALVCLRTKAEREVFMYSLLGVGVFVSLAAITGMTAATTRLSAFGATTIALGRLASVTAIGAVLIAMYRKGQRLLAVLVVPVALWAVLGSGTRQALLGLAVAAAAILLVRLVSGGAGRVILAWVLVGAIAVAVLSLSLLPERATRRVTTLSGSSADVRVVLADQAMDLAVEHPVLGVGTGGFAAYSTFDYPHNIVVEVAAENGLLAMGLLIVVLAGSIVAAWRRAREHPGVQTEFVLAGLLATMAFAMLSSDINGHRMLFVFVVLALAPVVSRRSAVPPLERAG